MNIYKVSEDFDFKDFSFETSEFFMFNGQSIIDDWKVPEFFMLEDKLTNKNDLFKEKNRLSDFDARCYGSILIIKNVFNHLFEALPIEILNINIANQSENFSFLNVTNVIEAISFENLNPKESMEMIKGNNINFIYDNVKNQILFRDKKLTNFYYCTDDFVKIINDNSIKGLRFDRVGRAIHL